MIKEPGIFPPKVIKEAVSFDDNKHSVTPENLHSIVNWDKVDDKAISQIRGMMDTGLSNKDIFIKMNQMYGGVEPSDSELNALAGIDAPDPVDSTVKGYFDAEGDQSSRNADIALSRLRMEENRITDPRTRRLAGLPALKEENTSSRVVFKLKQDLKTALMNLSRQGGLTLPEIKTMLEQTLLEIEPLIATASPEDTMDLAAGQRDQ